MPLIIKIFYQNDYFAVGKDVKKTSSGSASNDSDGSVYITGQMIQLSDGTTAFLEHAANNDNETFSPVRLDNGTIIYVASDSILHNLLQDSATELKENNVKIKEESKGFICNYDYCKKSYSSLHHLKVSFTQISCLYKSKIVH